MYREGILNPNKENEVVFYQRRVRECVYKQFEARRRKTWRSLREQLLRLYIPLRAFNYYPEIPLAVML